MENMVFGAWEAVWWSDETNERARRMLESAQAEDNA